MCLAPGHNTVTLVRLEPRKSLSSKFANNKDADQPSRSLNSTLLFAYDKVLYLVLLQAKFRFSS